MSETAEPMYELAHLGHAELLTPVYEQSLEFFVEVYGMDLVQESGGSAYLRAWGDHDLTTLKLTASDRAGLGHVGWRTISPQALDRRVAALEARGVTGEWIDGDVGHGKAYSFRTPSGQRNEIYYETEKYQAAQGKKSYLPNQPQSSVTRGAAVSRIDHINVLARDIPAAREFMCQTLGFKLREHLIPPDQPEAGAWLSLMNKAHDLAITREPADTTGRLHHLAYAVENREDVLRAADVFCELGTFIEFGPAKHSRTQGFFLYVYEPGGNRIEVFAGGFHIFAPDWEPVTWTTEGQGRSTAWGLDVPASFHTHATPVLP
ncbi:VOC family protein [Actinomadura rudentiformis]|uniref:Catechol 2,3-dioxygenase n=1 Tax=Actinomadura rudentiformis TaxID=359158 RepID=A0A6H9YS48_9ACTN|nr:VOC family protein [Actinomadura rudentiformis]KAB2343745.1 catechol 2,3-dioxygenase [Actinomadura rudentiformis]